MRYKNCIGIDTVQLAQILLPTQPSYRLVDLGNYLGIKHERPHQADSDTYVTAELFLLLQKRLDRTDHDTLILGRSVCGRH